MELDRARLAEFGQRPVCSHGRQSTANPAKLQGAPDGSSGVQAGQGGPLAAHQPAVWPSFSRPRSPGAGLPFRLNAGDIEHDNERLGLRADCRRPLEPIFQLAFTDRPCERPFQREQRGVDGCDAFLGQVPPPPAFTAAEPFLDHQRRPMPPGSASRAVRETQRKPSHIGGEGFDQCRAPPRTRDFRKAGRELAGSRRLSEVREAKRGVWLDWLDREFGWSERAAYRFMRGREGLRRQSCHPGKFGDRRRRSLLPFRASRPAGHPGETGHGHYHQPCRLSFDAGRFILPRGIPHPARPRLSSADGRAA